MIKEHRPKSTNQNQRSPIGANSNFFNKICHKRTQLNSSSSDFASTRSTVSKPSQNRLKTGSSTSTRLLVSYRTYRQLSVWNPPPQVFRAFGRTANMRHASEGAGFVLVWHREHVCRSFNTGDYYSFYLRFNRICIGPVPRLCMN